MKKLGRGEALNQILFTVEKIFTLQPAWNSQNHRIAAQLFFVNFDSGKRPFLPPQENDGLGWDFRTWEDQAWFCAKRVRINAEV